MSHTAKREARESAGLTSRAPEPRHASVAPCPTPPPPRTEAVVCERCGSASVYRMHAVWRCADCGYKTDCCGW